MITNVSRILIAIAATVFITSTSFADDVSDIMEKCKKEAADAKVSSDNLEDYMLECRADYGADTADSSGAINEMAPPAMEEGSAAPAEESSDSASQ